MREILISKRVLYYSVDKLMCCSFDDLMRAKDLTNFKHVNKFNKSVNIQDNVVSKKFNSRRPKLKQLCM